MIPVSNVYIYSEPRCGFVDFQEVTGFVRGYTPGAVVKLRGPLLEGAIRRGGTEPGEAGHTLQSRLALLLAKAKVKVMESPVPVGQSPLPGEVDYERRRLADTNKTVFGILYDAYLLSAIYRRLLDGGETGMGYVHVVFTNQLIGTWDEGDRRYHARSVLLGSPSIVSLSGMVEAPARATGYYLARRSAEAMGLAEEKKMELARSFDDDCLEHDDERMTEVAKGYAMQPVAYRLTGEVFCEDPDCRLFNAHW
ncbi:MAG TPA: hypothetical protein ENH44_04335, partial [Actinobacteria bacterium]|nr:hypothetical protein [Actinomycetota bacterium]